MPIRVVCDQCQAKYLIPDEHAGKKMRCKKCGEICPVPSGSRPSKAPTGPAKKPSKPSKPKAPAADEFDDYGDGPDDDEEDEELIARPVSRRAKKAKPKKAERSKSKRKNPLAGFQFDFTEARTILGLPAVGALLTMLVEGAAGDTAGVCVLGFIFVLAAILSLVSGVMAIIVAFEEDVLCGLLYLFLPLYALYHIITRWEEQKKPFLMSLCAMFVMFGQGAGIFVGKIINAALFKGAQ